MTITSKPLHVAVYLFVFVSFALAMPPLKGSFEPSYPPGVNAPAAERLNRDDPNLEGEWNCLVILIDFPDYTWDNQNDTNFANGDRVFTPGHFQWMLFSEGEYVHPGSASDFTGSMRDYYKEISHDMFATAGVATRWYRAPHDYSYYCNQDGEAGTDDDFGFGDFPNNAQGLVNNAIGLANGNVNYADFDNDDDGNVDALFVIHAGPGAEEFGDAGASYLWSHKWQIPERQLDGVTISGYTLEPENGTIGVFCHEFGHALGLPDLYDTDGSSEGIGEWGLMGSGGWCYRPGDPWGTCPTQMSGWEKKQLEWVEAININADVADLEILPVETEPTIYRVWRDGGMGNEYFLLENRQRIGFDAGLTRRQFDYGLPAPSGLLITHIDENQEGNSEDMHRLIDVEEASVVGVENGNWREHLNGRRIRPADRSLYNPNRGDNGDLWPGFGDVSEDSTQWIGNRTRVRFGRNTIPASSDYTGQPTLVEVSNIHFQNETILCDIAISAPNNPLLILGETEITDGENGNGIFEPGDTLTLIPHLRNIGQQPARNVSLTLEYFGELNVTIEPQGRVGYPDIGSDEEAGSRVPFIVTIPVDAPADARIDLDGTARCADQPEFDVDLLISLRPAGDWIKYVNNPVLAGTPGAWDAGGIASIDIIDYSDSLVAYYVGGSELGVTGIGRAVSVDYGESWTKMPDPVVVGLQQEWASGGIFGLAVIEIGDGFLMMIGGNDDNDSMAVASIGVATSDDGIDWNVSEDPSISSGGWCAGIFPVGQFDLLRFGNMAICSYGGITQQGFIALGASRSLNLVDWAADDQPTVLPTFSEIDFDGFACFSPDMYIGNNEVQLTYSGIGAEFVARLGLINVIDQQNFERYRGTETGGSILEADSLGWERGGFISGSRMFATPNGKRILYTALGEQSAGVGLALASGAQSVPDELEPRGTYLPQMVALGSAYPNPFNGQTVIPFSLRRAIQTVISVYDISGRMIFANSLGLLSAGDHAYTWNAGAGVANGLYFVKIETPLGEAKGRVLLLK